MLFSGTILVVTLGKELPVVPMQEKSTATAGQKNAFSPFDLFLLILTIFEVLLLVVVLTRSFAPSVPPAEQPDNREEQTQPTPDDDPPPVSKPVFSQGAISTIPQANADTVTLTTQIDSKYAILIDAETGMILAQKGADVAFAPASMTKVMTLIIACEMLDESDLEREVMMTDEMLLYVTSGAYYNTGRAGYEPGLKTKMKDLLYGIGVQSFSDCTVMAVASLCPASTVAESERLFVARMNQKAEEMGLRNTKFDNIVGHESENNYSTAADIAAIMSYALQCPMIKDILSAKTYDYHVWRLEPDATYERWTYHFYSTLFNANPKSSSRIKAYENYYGKTFALSSAVLGGGKTGTLEENTNVFSLVTYAVKDGRLYIAVTGETAKNYAVMNDAKILYDTYLK